MSQALLQTKLNIPVMRPHQVSRKRLVEMLDRGMAPGVKLTLVSAPAGFGKTTLLSEWSGKHDPRVAWLSLDESDSDPDRFFAYLIAAIQNTLGDPEFGETALSARQTAQILPFDVAYTLLLNELVETGGPLVLLLDDYHTISSQSIHDHLCFLLEHLPPQVHLYVGTRSDPPFGLARLRARLELNEVRLEDLRFTPIEAGAFLQTAVAVSLSQDHLNALEEKTEGWAAGLQLAALSLRGDEDPGNFIARLSGADRYIFDYLAEEVLSRQTRADQAFLMTTSILNRLNGDLCDAVTRGENGRLQLERLEANNLFIRALDNQRAWYRYHQLFSGFLRDRLVVMQADEIPRLHRRAAAWLAAEGFVSEAVDHWLQAGDFEQAADHIEGRIRQLLLGGEITTIIRWLESMSMDFVRSRPRLCLALVWGYVFGGRGGWENVTGLIADAALGLGVAGGDVAEALATYSGGSEALLPLCDLAILQAFLAREMGDTARAITLFEAVRAYRPKDDILLGPFSAGGLGSLYLRAGNVRMAEEAFASTADFIQRSGHRFGLALALNMLGVTQVWQGRLGQAADTFRRAMESATDNRGRLLPFAGQPTIGLGRVHWERNDLETALNLCQEGVRLSDKVKDLDGLLEGRITLARILMARGDPVAAEATLAEAGKVAERMSVACVNRVSTQRTIFELQRGVPGAGGDSGRSDEAATTPFGDVPSLVHARLLAARGRAADALPILEHQLAEAEKDNRVYNMLEILAFQAICLSGLNLREQAIQALARALLIAGPEGYLRVFLEEGPAMAALVRAAASQGHASGFTEKLLAAFGQIGGDDLLEPLSDRELEVLGHIANGFTNVQIASELTIAVSTVKTHINRIYGKLGVRTRTQAVVRGRKLRLIR